MALFGHGGILELGRERPDPTVLTLSRVEDQHLVVQNPAFWPSDFVTITSSTGLPFDINGDGYADCPDGHGMYRDGQWEIGPPRAFWQPWIDAAQPVPLVLHSQEATINPAADSLLVQGNTFVTGDRVVLTSFGGLPIDVNQDGYPDNPDGLGFYGGSVWVLGPGILRLSDGSLFYQPDNGAGMYDSSADVGLTTLLVCYVSVDSINSNQIALYDTKAKALSTLPANRIPLFSVGFRKLIIAKLNPDVEQISLDLLSDYAETIYAMTDTSYATVPLTDLLDVDYAIYLPPGVTPYYVPDNNSDFYCNEDNVGFATAVDAFISRDEFDRVFLYTNALGALNEGYTFRIPFHNVDARTLLIALFNGTAGFKTALLSASAAINALPLASLPSEEFSLQAAVTLPELVSTANAEPLWRIQGDLQSWALDIDASALDTSAVGDTYGDAIKAMVRGAGSLQFLVERRLSSTMADALTLLRLVLLTQQGSKAQAKFYLYKNRDQRLCVNAGEILPEGSLYYLCDILLSNSKVSTSAEDLINGSTDFVVVGEPKLRATGFTSPETVIPTPPIIDQTDILDQSASCIAVIDESSVSLSIHTDDWELFTASWPQRTFTLLVPGNLTDVPRPAGWTANVQTVNRDNGNVLLRSDWFALAQLQQAQPGHIVYLFVDQSGSLTESVVQESYDYFLQQCSAAQLTVVEVSNAAERYIHPFISTPDPELA